jgi:hypothetical protein
MAHGSFSFEALQAYEALVAETHPLNFSEGETYDFTRCVRKDGTIYGSRGKCKQGTEIGAKEESQVKGKRGPKAGGMRLTEKIKGLGAEDLKKVLQDPRVTPKQRAVLEGLLKSKGGVKAPEGQMSKKGSGPDRKTSREELRKAVSENNPKVQDEYDWVGSGPKAVAEIKRSYRMMQTLVKSPELDTVANKARLINLRLLIYQKERELKERKKPGRDPKTYEADLKNSPKYDKTPGSSSPIPKRVPKDSGETELPWSPSLKSLYEKQGFNAKPELVATVDDLRKRKDIVTNSDGSPRIFYRGVGDEKFADQFKGLGSEGGSHYPGKGIFGNGSYAAAPSYHDPSEASTREAIKTAKAYAGERNNLSSKVTAFALRKDANIVQFSGKTAQEGMEQLMGWREITLNEAQNKTGYRFKDLGEAAAAVGIHAFTFPSLGKDYLVLLNRGAIIAAMDSQIPDENE